MSFRNCIEKLKKDGVIDAARAKEADDLFVEIEAEALGKMSPEAASGHARDEAMRILTDQLGEKKRQLVLASGVAGRIEDDFTAYLDKNPGAHVGDATEQLFDRSEGIIRDFGPAPYLNVDRLHSVNLSRAHARMADAMAEFRPGLTGKTRNTATLKNMVHEAFGEETGDISAREFAKAWGNASEFSRKRFNRFGGRIPKRSDWGLPQYHDAQKVGSVGFDEWRGAIIDDLDATKMIDEATGKPITAERLEPALKDVYEAIRTDGASKFTPSGQARGVKLANRRLDHRFLVFRDADAWLKYQERFGAADAYSTMMQHLDAMARDTALLQVLGPNPAATVRWLEGKILNDGKLRSSNLKKSRPLSQARKSVRTVNNMYAWITGTSRAPVNADMANIFGATRNVLQSAQLGSAFISALTDINFRRMALKNMGAPQYRAASNMTKLFTPDVTAHQKQAVRAGLGGEAWLGIAHGQSRYIGEITGPEWSKRLSDGVMRASLLSPWTEAGRWGFGMDAMGWMAEHAGKSFRELPPLLRDTLKRYGIEEDGWRIISETNPYAFEGGTWIRAEDISIRGDIAPELADDIATRYLSLIQTETQFAVPSNTLRGKVAFLGSTQSGTLIGEVLRSAVMYRSFATTIVFTHLARAAGQIRRGDRGAYLAELVISTMAMGALVVQMKAIQKGLDPTDMFTPEFAGAALLQGGGLGIFGDFLFQDQSRAGGSLGETLAGPIVGFGSDALDLTVGNVATALRGEDPRLGRDVVNFARRYTPGSSLWFARLGLERLVFDRLQELADPDARASFRARERRTRRATGQRFFFRPGRTSPDRLPDLTKAFEVN